MSNYQKLNDEMIALCAEVKQIGGDVLSVARNYDSALGEEGNLLHQILDLKAYITRLKARKERWKQWRAEYVAEKYPHLTDEEDLPF